jgi:hypothetical protein
MEIPKRPDIKIHVESTDPETIWNEVYSIAAKYSLIYKCAVLIKETVTVGEDGKLYRGYEIEKKSPAVKN